VDLILDKLWYPFIAYSIRLSDVEMLSAFKKGFATWFFGQLDVYPCCFFPFVSIEWAALDWVCRLL